MEKIINFLKTKNQTISTMESCTGGLLASELTNIDGSSNVFNLGLVTYSNEYKIYFGVSKEAINEYTVYSNEVSREMAKSVSLLSNSDWGIGITGQLGTRDLKNNSNDINKVYITIYNRNGDKYYNYLLESQGETRLQKKYFVINYIKERLNEIFE